MSQQAFSTYFQTNGTHLKCYSNEEWAKDWFGIDQFDWTGVASIACNTSNSPVATITWK